MGKRFYIDSTDFVNYGIEHFVSVLVMVVFGILFLKMGKRWNEEQKWKYPIIFAISLLCIQLFKSVIRLYLGNFDITEDLPLHLCNFLPMLMIIGLIYKSLKLISVLFFWILGGTIQANVTPTLLDVFPHYEAIRYWTVHMGLPILAIYTAYVLEYRFTFRDALRSALSLNIVVAIVYPLNLLLGSNYMYLVHKPPPGTIFDILGPWPWYILSLELVMFVLFAVLLIPFWWIKFKDKQKQNVVNRGL